MISTFLGYNESSPGGATNTLRGLTHSLDLTKEGLGMNPTRICTIDGCDKPARTRGLCNPHHLRLLRHGDPMAGGQARLRNEAERLAAHTERRGECLVWTGDLNEHGYGRIVSGGRKMRVHRYVYQEANGPIPGGMEVDHTCHNRACVELSHLRLVTRKQNLENLSGAREFSATGVRGVYPLRRNGRDTGRFVAEVKNSGRRYHLGVFPTIEEADRAVVAKRLELYTHNEVDKLRAQTILRSLDQKETP
mgnify:FL=1